MKKSFYIISLLLFLFACEKKVDWELQTEELNTIVVEAVITNELKHQMIKLSYPVLQMNQTPAAVIGADVSIAFEPYIIAFIESETNPGEYYSEIPFRAIQNVTYSLSIKVNATEYTAEAELTKIWPFTPPPFHYKEDKGLYTLYWDIYQYNPVEQALYEVIIDFGHLPGYNHPDSLSIVKMQYYRLKTIDVSYIVAPQDREKVYFPAGSIASFSKYSLNDEYGAYLRALLIESQWQGSMFEGARGNLPGNISNDGLGFFAACAVLRDTIVIGE